MIIRWQTLCIVIGYGSSCRILLVELGRTFIVSESEFEGLLCIRALGNAAIPEDLPRSKGELVESFSIGSV